MSEYADIVVKNLSLAWFRNYVNSYVVSLFFTKKDLSIMQNCKIDLGEDGSEEYTQYVYRTTVKKAKERLEAQGFSIGRLEKLFNEKMRYAIDYTHYLLHLDIDFDEYEEKAREGGKKKVSFAKWKNAVQKIIAYELVNGNISPYKPDDTIKLSTECDKIIYHSVKASDGDAFYGLITEHINIGYIYRLILESFDDADEIILDFSNLQYWDEDCIPKALAATDDVEKTIILVEGTSDKDILEFAISHIYPHLADLFYFMDFSDVNGNKRDGGTSYVVKNLKTFYYSRLKANFIAVFDNDAEGYQCKCNLMREAKKWSEKRWPDNFRILLYPDNKLFQKYPTLAPNGKLLMDCISRKACSIELYLPDELISSNGNYLPIEWESRKKITTADGNVEVLYQGVISQKEEIKDRYHALRKSIEKGEKAFELEDWERMKQLLDTIVFAFTKD